MCIIVTVTYEAYINIIFEDKKRVIFERKDHDEDYGYQDQKVL